MNASGTRGLAPTRLAPRPTLSEVGPMGFLDSPPCFPKCIETVCDCGVTLHIRRHDIHGSYTIQHGSNPEHKSGLYPGTTLFISGARDWLQAVHNRG